MLDTLNSPLCDDYVRAGFLLSMARANVQHRFSCKWFGAMQLKSLFKFGGVACMIGCSVMASSAQVPSQSGGVLLVMPVAGHVIRVRQVEEHIVLRAGLPSATEAREKIIYRDLMGRMRIEPVPKADQEPNTGTTTLIDPVKGSITILDPNSKTAVRVTGAVMPNQSGFLLPRLDQAVPTADWDTATDSLAPLKVEGFEFTGTRITHVSPRPSSSTIIYEWWVSSTSGLIAKASAISSGETRRYRIAEFEWDAKMNADLFVIPSGYATQDLSLRQPGKE